MNPLHLAQTGLRSIGYEFLPYPPRDWVRSRDALGKLLKDLAIDCVIDVGANHGQFGGWLRDLGFRGSILSFEPVHSVFEQLARQAALRPPWKAFPYALGAENGQMEINLGGSDDLTSFLTSLGPSKTLPNHQSVGRETVEVRRLDAILDECLQGIEARRIFLKLDTQGFDLQVLRGADGILSKVLGIQIELSFVPIYEGMPGYLESLKEVEEKGFGVVDFVPVTRVADSQLMMEMDCLLCRK